MDVPILVQDMYETKEEEREVPIVYQRTQQKSTFYECCALARLTTKDS
jgi:hypothetical protein